MKYKSMIAILTAVFIWGMSTIINTVYLFYIPQQFEVNELTTGIILSLNFIAIFLGTMLFSKLVKKMVLSKLLKLITFLSIISCIMASVVYDKLLVIFFTMLIYFFAAITSLITRKLIALIKEEEVKKQTFSYFFTVVSISGVIVSILGPYLYQKNINNLQGIYLAIGFLQFVAYFPLAYSVKVITKETTTNIKDNEKIAIKGKVKYPKFKIFSLINKQLLTGICGLFFGIFQISYLIPKFLESHYSLQIYTLFLIMHTVICIISGPILLKVFKQQNASFKIKLVGYFLSISFGLFIVGKYWTLIIATILFSLAQVLLFSNLDIYLLNIYQVEQYDEVTVIVRLFTQTMEIISAPIASLVIYKFKIYYAFMLIIIIIIIALLYLQVFERQKVN
ncbi:MAG: MFS transporter [Mycoplasmatales bacterium]